MRNLPTRSLIAAALLIGLSAGVARASLPFIEDDYPKAVVEARSRNVPIFVEAWAPW